MCHGDSEGCGCPAGKTERFLQPSLLLALKMRPSYGYELIEKISSFGFVDGNIDPGIIYRHLRRLETEGFVSSRWDTTGSGPARRYYHLTREGEELLRNWIPFMQKSKDALSRFLDHYERSASGG
ncbi:MAG: helix-turn-helix transcriptional regulator [Deltaproteobacteria bacterium]|nr:helix-turn-helix transcriptional regulator [Deltaproteobacteria bacterium]MBW2070909.1 helix-turn-helix transcriptional regulator [Deltaproteobacteria bacterium]